TYGYDQRLEVHGSRGMLRVNNVLDTQVESATESGFKTSVAQAFFLERFGAAYLAEMKYFVDALTEGKQPQPDAIDGLKAQTIADAATLSWKEGRPVEITA
ncbi:inositol 2-dehydrogenase, partial [Escherichia coli]|uniref:Gfo/Idh/MocA family oxidoreductase n=1 Tax=Escherichia coli TaxID=562 RepID=UPI000F288995